MNPTTRRLLTYVLLVATAVASWWLGAWSACGSDCSFDTALFEAIGTWVGGVGITTVGGVYVWLRNRSDSERQTTEAWRVAYMCTLRCRPLWRAGAWSKVQIEFTNHLLEHVTDVEVHLVGGATLRTDKVVAPGRTWGDSVPMDGLGLVAPTDEQEARALVNSEVRPRVVFVFSVRGHRFLRSGSELFHYDDAPTHLLPWASTAN